MAEITPHQLVEVDPDFEPLSRPRSCTWPLPRPEFIEPPTSSTSSPAPSLQLEPANGQFVGNLTLFEETEGYAERRELDLCTDFQCPGNCAPGAQHHGRLLQQTGPQQGTQLPHQQQVPQRSSPARVNSLAVAQRKSSSSRRNAWGSMSYADLISKAIESSEEKRLTLSQIYDWMVKNVPYFKDKGESNSSAGWKNSIRHNLSLHSRFVRVQNEGTGKSSWWMLNPEGGKCGKSARRRAVSMDNNSKFSKSRGRAAKKKMALQEGVEGGGSSPGSQYSNWLGSPNSHSNDDFEAWSTFRKRASSDASTLSGHHSPFLSEQDDLAEADLHMPYPGGAGSKMAGTLPSLSEVSRTMGHDGTERLMESLLENLNVLSPENSRLGSDSPCSSNSSMLQQSPYSSPGMAPQQDYKCPYSQAVMNSLSPMPMRTLPDVKPSFGPFLNHYSCPQGILKELLTSDADPCRDMMPPTEPVVSQAGMGGHLLPSYTGPGQTGVHDRIKMMSSPQPPLPPHAHPRRLHCQSPPSSGGMNGCDLIPLTSLSRGPRLACPRTFTQLADGPSVRVAGGMLGYSSSNGYGQLGPAPQHRHHQERLPSDLDDVSIESLECDMESVLRDTLMDEETLDFSFEPAACLHRVKVTPHS